MLRGLHPLMSERLHLWRLGGVRPRERLDAPEDVHLFRGVARANPADERLFALAEVRDLTPVRDDRGRVAALPGFERMLVETLEAMRAVQAPRKQSRRLLWNRILLHVWPVIDLTPEELRRLVGRLAPATSGLGIEMISLRSRPRSEIISMPRPDVAGASRPTSRRSSSGVRSITGHTCSRMRFHSSRRLCLRGACTARIASSVSTSMRSNPGSAATRPRSSRTGVRSRTSARANSRSSAGFARATPRNRWTSSGASRRSLGRTPPGATGAAAPTSAGAGHAARGSSA